MRARNISKRSGGSPIYIYMYIYTTPYVILYYIYKLPYIILYYIYITIHHIIIRYEKLSLKRKEYIFSAQPGAALRKNAFSPPLPRGFYYNFIIFSIFIFDLTKKRGSERLALKSWFFGLDSLCF